MAYSIPRYPHGAPGKSKYLCTIGMSEKSHPLGVIYLNHGIPVTPLHQPVFGPTYGQTGEHARLRNHFYPLKEGLPDVEQYYHHAIQ